MTTYYVGPMGNDNNSGRTWETRLATLNGAEDKPIAAGDTVYVAPGVYREQLTIDINGNAGNYITYIGDVTGEHTDGVGGPVRVTGSDNDQSAARNHCVFANGRDYRRFRGFMFDTSATVGMLLTGDCDYWIIEDCNFQVCGQHNIEAIGTISNITIRRCVFEPGNAAQYAIEFENGVTQDDTDCLIENCVIRAATGSGVSIRRIGGVTVRNCRITASWGVRVHDALAVGQTVTVRNCIFYGCNKACQATAAAEYDEDYNTFFGNITDRINVNVGANSVAYPALFEPPLLNAGYNLVSGFRLPWWDNSPSRWSQTRQLAGANEPDEDLFGSRRPHTHGGPVAAFCSWGPVQWFDSRRSDIRAYDGSLSMRQEEKSAAWMFVPGVSATSHTISVRNWRTAGYGGHRNPEMIIKQPGQADRRTVAGGAAGAWVQLSDTFTPAADPPWLLVEMRNNCDFTTTTTVSTTSTTTVSTTSTTTQTVSTLTTTTTTLACDVWWDDLQVA